METVPWNICISVSFKSVYQERKKKRKKKEVCLPKPSFINKKAKLCRITNQVHLMGDTVHFI